MIYLSIITQNILKTTKTTCKIVKPGHSAMYKKSKYTYNSTESGHFRSGVLFTKLRTDALGPYCLLFNSITVTVIFIKCENAVPEILNVMPSCQDLIRKMPFHICQIIFVNIYNIEENQCIITMNMFDQTY